MKKRKKEKRKQVCNGCNENTNIVNKHFGLCLRCNQLRLQKNKSSKKKSIGRSSASKAKTEKKIDEDEEIYERVFNALPCKCEECGAPLPEDFRDENGKVIARYQYSHIIPKSIAAELRHSVENFNRLCLIHHIQWENG